MFYISGVTDDKVYITDSKDDVTEKWNLDSLFELCNITRIHGQELLKIHCKTDNAMLEFIKLISGYYAKHIVMKGNTRVNNLWHPTSSIIGKHTEYDSSLMNFVKDEALKFGFIKYDYELYCDLDNNCLVFWSLNKLITWDSNYNLIVYKELDLNTLDCLPMNVICSYITTYYIKQTIGDCKYSINELLSRDIIKSFNIKEVFYIGYNKKSKYLHLLTLNGEHIRLKWGTYQDFIINLPKIKKRGNVYSKFFDYCGAVERKSIKYANDNIYLVDFQISFKNGYDYELIHEMYETIEDIYCAKDYL